VTVFAVAKLVVINDLWEIDEVDPRLLETCQRSKGPKKIVPSMGYNVKCPPRTGHNFYC
jgi:hypothetical protein